MTLTKSRLATALLTVIASAASNAEVVIISDSQAAANKPNLTEVVVTSETTPNEELHRIDVEELPLVFVVDNIANDAWNISYANGSENTPITWKGQHKSWVSLVKFIAIDHDIEAEIDFDEKRIAISNPNADGEEIERIKKEYVTNTDSQDVADGVMTCMAIGCERHAIDIEKLAIDNSWFAEKADSEDSDDVTGIDARVTKLVDGAADLEQNKDDKKTASINMESLAEKEREADRLREQAHRQREAQMREDFADAIVLHGRGSYEEWMNGGGKIPMGKADPDTKYTYLLKKGSMFANVERWAEANGFVVDNIIKDKYKKDFSIKSDVYIYGNYYEVTTNLLKRYRGAKFPVNHKFYKQGKTLRIFSEKYNITNY